jgi:hypothetical protein
MRAARRTLDLRPRRGRILAAIAASALLASSAVALGALPKHGASFAGTTAAVKINGFSPLVRFTVAKNGKSLDGFRYSTLGCLGGGGFRPGVDYYAKTDWFIKVGTVKVTANGHFSATGATFSNSIAGVTTTTTTNVNGRFSKSKTASGTIFLSQKITGKFTSSCESTVPVHFTATAH